jgi:hypothetical protein
MAAEIERLRQENALLRERFATVQTIALEREETIEDLRHALQMLPSVWAEKLEGRLGPVTEGADQPLTAAAHMPGSPAHAASAPDHLGAPAPTREKDVSSDQAEAFFAEIAALRVRLERKRLEAEQEILEQERKRLLADIEWTRKWQRSRGVPPTEE